MAEQHLIRRTERQWLKRIKAVANKNRLLFHKLCAMIWWDYCEELTPCEKLKELAHTIDLSHLEFSEEALYNALVELGYSEPIARERARRKLYDDDEDINIL